MELQRQIKNRPCSRHPRDVQCTPINPLFSWCTAIPTKIRSFMSPRQSNGMQISLHQIGLKPLSLTTAVRKETVRADTVLVLEVVVGGFTLPVVAPSERNGETDHSGMCSETSTKGSTIDFSIISRPSESRKRGSC
jgi:hypothetical protein